MICQLRVIGRECGQDQPAAVADVTLGSHRTNYHLQPPSEDYNVLKVTPSETISSPIPVYVKKITRYESGESVRRFLGARLKALSGSQMLR